MKVSNPASNNVKPGINPLVRLFYVARNVKGGFNSLATLQALGVVDQYFPRHGEAGIPGLYENSSLGSRSVDRFPAGLQVSAHLRAGPPSLTASDKEDTACSSRAEDSACPSSPRLRGHSGGYKQRPVEIPP